MPLPTDEKLLALANDLIAQFDAIFGRRVCTASPKSASEAFTDSPPTHL